MSSDTQRGPQRAEKQLSKVDIGGWVCRGWWYGPNIETSRISARAVLLILSTLSK